jgi:hypothetical protein
MNKHTPGPLQYAMIVGGTTAFIMEDDGTTVAEISTVENSTGHSQLEANVRLFAAAPDLLEALNRVMSWIDNWSPEFTYDNEWPQDRDATRAAIAKATRDIQ